MIDLLVKVPFAGEALSVFKSTCDYITHGDFAPDSFEKVSDEEVKFSESLTVGVFRLLLDGNCVFVDKDFDNLATLMTVSSKDRGGKGRIDAKVKFFVSDAGDELICESQLSAKGMLARVELPFKDVFEQKIEKILTQAISESSDTIVIDDFADVRSIPMILHDDEVVENIDEQVLSKIVESGNLRGETNKKPVWVYILQLPANLLLLPFNLLRRLTSPA